jgi:hypothetical protein
MKALLRILLLLTVLAYGGQAAFSQAHLHGGGERSDCAACAFQSLPGEPQAGAVTVLPPSPCTGEAVVLKRAAPPPALTPLDFHYSTAPPAAA